jgi:hypothetical protein
MSLARILVFLRQAFGPTPGDRWPDDERLRWLRIARLLGVPVAITINLTLWWSMLADPHVHQPAARAFMLVNNLLLALDFVITLAFMRRRGRGSAFALVAGGVLEMMVMLVHLQMTGFITHNLSATHAGLAVTYRMVVNYWSGLVVFATAVLGVVVTYLLEDAQQIPSMAGFWGVHDTSAGTHAFAFLGQALFLVIGVATLNFVMRAIERGRADLAEARAELAAVVDEARLGRLSGLRMGSYQLGELLGRGGMGEVYAARRDDGSPVALKVLHAHLGAETGARARFRREADLVRRLPAQIVAQVHEVGTGPGDTDFIAMELLTGEDLGALLRRRSRLTLHETSTLALHVARALAQAHAASVVHRDLKPSNVFLVEGQLDQVRLLDFGIARLYDAPSTPSNEDAPLTLTGTAVVLGSPGYLAPEQARGESDNVGPGADVFALGAIVYRALTGQQAFAAAHFRDAGLQALYHVPPPPSDLCEVPRGVDLVVGTALAKSLEHRYTSALTFAHDLMRAAEGESFSQLTARARTGVRSDVEPLTVSSIEP